MLGKL